MKKSGSLALSLIKMPLLLIQLALLVIKMLAGFCGVLAGVSQARAEKKAIIEAEEIKTRAIAESSTATYEAGNARLPIKKMLAGDPNARAEVRQAIAESKKARLERTEKLETTRIEAQKKMLAGDPNAKAEVRQTIAEAKKARLERLERAEEHARIEAEAKAKAGVEAEEKARIEAEIKKENLRIAEKQVLENQVYFTERLIQLVIVPLLQEGYREEAIIVLLSFTNLNYNEIVGGIIALEGEESVDVLKSQVTNIIKNGLKDESKFSQIISYIKRISSNSVSNNINETERIKINEFLKKLRKTTTEIERIKISEFLEKLRKTTTNDRIATLENTNSIEGFYLNLLMCSVYPILWHKEIDISYNDDNKALVMDYKLPLLEEVCVVDYNGKKLKEKEQNKLYSSVLYQICLRTIDEIFSQNKNNDVDSITFNGMITAIDKATGKHKTACVMSLQLNRNVFDEINLENVDARECFKYLKGVGAAELSSITPVNPIRTIDKSDRRFVDAYGVLDNINSGTNLAAINWQDFENLIREVFEKEFSQNGGEVKITQASRDGGVDAIAFDPDPIRGGKIVIQAKRYTNTVGVSAVRDLYGTLMNEGANNGILVTTSDYGSDAYEFANGKPIKLLNGAELLGLMEKHGYKAYEVTEKGQGNFGLK
jgi:restriction system protein